MAPLRRRSFPSTRHQLNLGLVQYFNIFYHKKILQFFGHFIWNTFSRKFSNQGYVLDLKSGLIFPGYFAPFDMIYLYLHFVETKNLRVDSSGDLDFPQLENSLQVKPFLLTNISLIKHKKTQIQKLTHTLCHHLYPSHLCRASHITLKSLRSLRCRLELGKNTVNSNSTTGLFVFIFFSFDKHSPLQTNCESEGQPSSLGIATWPSSSSPRWSCSSCATCQESSPGWCSSHYCGHHHRHHGQHHLHQLNLQHL